MDMLPRRIAVVGRAGAGKTTIARRLGEAFDVPVVHLDTMFWGRDWMEVERETFEAQQLAAIETEAWVIDGGYLTSRGWPARLARSELVVVAEAPIVVCVWRVVRRALTTGRRRPDMPAGAHEEVSAYFLWWIATWGRRHPRLAETLRSTPGAPPVAVVRSPADLEALIDATGSVR